MFLKLTVLLGHVWYGFNDLRLKSHFRAYEIKQPENLNAVKLLQSMEFGTMVDQTNLLPPPVHYDPL